MYVDEVMSKKVEQWSMKVVRCVRCVRRDDSEVEVSVRSMDGVRSEAKKADTTHQSR